MKKEISSDFDKKFPAVIKLSEDIQAKRIDLAQQRIEDPTKPNPHIQTLNQAKELKGVLMCSSYV